MYYFAIKCVLQASRFETIDREIVLILFIVSFQNAKFSSKIIHLPLDLVESFLGRLCTESVGNFGEYR